MSDDQEPKTYRNNACYKNVVDTFSGPILDNATKYESKDDVPANHAKHSVIAPEDDSEVYGILMEELFQTVAARCASAGGLSGNTVAGKVKLK